MSGATNKITALYRWLSQEDERAGESLSIENQRRFLSRLLRLLPAQEEPGEMRWALHPGEGSETYGFEAYPTGDGLHSLVQAIYVGTPDKSSGKRRQSIHIKYNGPGFIPLDALIKPETA